MPVWPVNQRMPSRIEDGGVEVRAAPVAGQREDRDLVGVGIDPDDRVQAAVGDPGVAVRPGDDAVRRGPGTERDRPDVAGRRVEVAERAVVLARVPDAAVGRGRDVVRMRAGHDVELPDGEGDGGSAGWRRGRRWGGGRGARWRRGRRRGGGRGARWRRRRRSAPAGDEHQRQAQQAEAAQEARVARHEPMMPREPKSVERRHIVPDPGSAVGFGDGRVPSGGPELNVFDIR